MLLESYTLEIFNPECRPGAMPVHCFAHLDHDVSECGSWRKYLLKRPAVRRIQNPREADNHSFQDNRRQCFKKRGEIEPLYEASPQPQVFEILKLMPKTNCKECGHPTCMVFAFQVAEGGKGPEDCLPLDEGCRDILLEYLSRFRFDF